MFTNSVYQLCLRNPRAPLRCRLFTNSVYQQQIVFTNKRVFTNKAGRCLPTAPCVPTCLPTGVYQQVFTNRRLPTSECLPTSVYEICQVPSNSTCCLPTDPCLPTVLTNRCLPTSVYQQVFTNSVYQQCLRNPRAPLRCLSRNTFELGWLGFNDRKGWCEPTGHAGKKPSVLPCTPSPASIWADYPRLGWISNPLKG